MIGETAKLVSLSGPKEVIIRPYCSKKCAATTVKSFIDGRICIWCGKEADPISWELGGFGEPYCCKECWSAAGRAMFDFEFLEGNIP